MNKGLHECIQVRCGEDSSRTLIMSLMELRSRTDVGERRKSVSVQSAETRQKYSVVTLSLPSPCLPEVALDTAPGGGH